MKRRLGLDFIISTVLFVSSALAKELPPNFETIKLFKLSQLSNDISVYNYSSEVIKRQDTTGNVHAEKSTFTQEKF